MADRTTSSPRASLLDRGKSPTRSGAKLRRGLGALVCLWAVLSLACEPLFFSPPTCAGDADCQVKLGPLKQRWSCQEGRCICPGGFALCVSGSPERRLEACVQLSTSEAHCGACGQACEKGRSCCGAACVELPSDPRHCGACGKVCKGARSHCKDGACRCPNQGVFCHHTCLPKGSTCVETLFRSHPGAGTPLGEGSLVIQGMGVDPAGAVWLATSKAFGLRRLQPSGTLGASLAIGRERTRQAGGGLSIPSKELFVAFAPGGSIYVSDAYSRAILRLRPEGGGYATALLAGSADGSGGLRDGPGARALFHTPGGIALGPKGALYVADTGNHAIRKLSPTKDGYAVTTLAGSGAQGRRDGAGSDARFYGPVGVALGEKGQLFVADALNCAIRELSPSTQGYAVRTLAGSTCGSRDGVGDQAMFDRPWGIAWAAPGILYVADAGNHRIRKLRLTKGGYVVTTLAGSGVRGHRDGAGPDARFDRPSFIALGPKGTLVVASPFFVRSLKPYCPHTQEFCGGECVAFDPLNDPRHCGGCEQRCPPGSSCKEGKCRCTDGAIWCKGACHPKGTVCVETLAGTGFPGLKDGPGDAAMFDGPRGLAMDPAGQLYVSDARNRRIRKISPSGQVSTYAGLGEKQPPRRDGGTSYASFSEPRSLAFDGKRARLLIADIYPPPAVLRQITRQGIVKSLSTSFGGFSAGGFVLDQKGDGFAASGNFIAKIALSDDQYTVQYIAGSIGRGLEDGLGASARFNNATHIALGPKGALYVTDTGNHAIRKLSPTKDGYRVTTLAGSKQQQFGFRDGPGDQALFTYPEGIAVDKDGHIYVADSLCAIRKLSPTKDGYVVTTLAGSKQQRVGFRDGPGDQALFAAPMGLLLSPDGKILYVADLANHSIRKITLSK